MNSIDEPVTDETSVLDAAVIDYIDSEELTDTATLPEPLGEKLADKIAQVIEDTTEAVKSHTDRH